ncbi:MAG: hypothetical protein K0V04_46600 [Deltaproteobacteria bacterium]|nr:hypothetical protein [Deltaproteobacteria bacterium]
MTCPRTSIPWLLVPLLAFACDSKSLGKLESSGGETAAGTHSPTGPGSGGSGDSATGPSSASSSGSATGSNTTADDGGETGPLNCDAPFYYFEPPTCPTGALAIPERGCYVPCDPVNDTCQPDTTCLPVEINPCPCLDNEPCCDACAGETFLCLPPQFDPACTALVGTFTSVDELECGLGPGGMVALCHWMITFDGSAYDWLYSDVGEVGPYACAQGQITTDNGTDGTYDPLADTLVWSGVAYVRAP